MGFPMIIRNIYFVFGLKNTIGVPDFWRKIDLYGWIITYCIHFKQLKTIKEIWLAKLIIKIMTFEHQQQQF